MFIQSNSNLPIGLDISDLSIKLVQLKKKRKGVKIQALSKISLPEGIIEGGEIKNEDVFVQELTKLISKPAIGPLTSNEVVACLPETKTFIKLIEIPPTPNKISDVIEHEIEKYVPFGINEMYYDWQKIRTLADKDLILIGAAPRNIVDQYTSVLTRCHLKINALEIESQAISRAISPIKSEKSENYAILDIGAKRTSMTIYALDTIIMSISMPISGEETTQKIANTLEISREQAEKAKIVCGLDKTKAKGVIYEILSNMINDLSQKIIETINFYNSQHPETGQINKILLCGGGSNIKDLDQIITKSTSVKTEIANSFINLAERKKDFAKHFFETHGAKNKEKNVYIKQDISLTYATAIGLALRKTTCKN